MKIFNVSNHPSNKWSEEQKNAANGEIIDIPFPAVNPNATVEDIQSMAENIVADITKDSFYDTAVVHVMGEMTLTYAIVSKLKSRNYKCVASTTERTAVENGDGTKTTKFEFVQFRNY